MSDAPPALPPCSDPALLPLLPFVYVAWADGALTPNELHVLRTRMVQSDLLDANGCREVEAWLDPDAPPDPAALLELRNRIRDGVRASALGTPDSLTDLGLGLAGAADTLPSWTGESARAALEDMEELLGVHGAAAAQSLIAPEERPPVREDPDPPAFGIEEMARYLARDHHALRAEVFALLTTREMRSGHALSRGRYRARVLDQLRILADRGYGCLAYPVSVGGEEDIGASLAVFETLAYGDLSLLVKFGVQFGLFGGSILNLGSARHHERYLGAVGALDLPGCFAMSETRHGSNVRDLETVAVWEPASGEFILTTPHPLARKDWIGNAAAHGRMATVFAQLEVDGHRHGVHAFLVPIRDETGEPLPGISIGDCGAKVGLEGVDNGWIAFDHVSVPLDNLLDRFAQVTEDGRYVSEIASPGRRFFTMIGTLVAGRVSIAAASLSSAKTALAIAVRYGERRRQFGPPEAPEVPLLDYRVHQRLLLPRLATTYALNFAVRDLADRYAAQAERPDREVEVRAAGLKAFASWHNLDTVQACREACGGKGYLTENRFGALRDDTDVFTTFEGANVVLLQLVAKGLLTRFREELGDLNVWGMVRYLADQAGARLQTLNPVLARRTDSEHLRSPEFHLSSFADREERLLASAARRLKSRLDDGTDPFQAMNEVQDHLVTLALAHVDRILLESMQRSVARAPAAGVSDTLRTVTEAFALTTLERHRGWYLEAGFMEPGKTRALRRELDQVLLELRSQAVHLVDGFGIPDAVLRAPAAFVDEWPEGETP